MYGYRPISTIPLLSKVYGILIKNILTGFFGTIIYSGAPQGSAVCYLHQSLVCLPLS